MNSKGANYKITGIVVSLVISVMTGKAMKIYGFVSKFIWLEGERRPNYELSDIYVCIFMVYFLLIYY